MDINQYRVGNIAKWDLNDLLDWEDDFDYGYSETSLEEWQLENPERIQPILITREWLLKFGLSSNEILYLAQDKIFTDEEGFKYYEYEINEVTIHTEIKLEHLHQLQNLYYYRSGEELQIKKDG